MANERLGAKNTELLLDHYRSERKRLIFQLKNVRDQIIRLKAIRAREVKQPVEGQVRRGPGRPRKEITEGTDMKRGPGRSSSSKPSASAVKRRKRKKTGGYRLSDWDEMVIEAITGTGLLPKQLIVDRGRAWVKASGKRMSAADVEAKITRVLQKLSGSRGVLGKYRTGLRRGYHYGLKEWFFASSGALRKQHLEKLVDLEAK
ncbi:MAG: hypothetical protein JNM62_11580 [Flavobacteriales bacterium]|nr:hypothetical protein [Flavobacteriales bacterium]